jgi:beta-N-acetylhexosaminidase
MKAISATRGLGEATVDAIAAGCDVVLLCNNPIDEQVEALETVIRAMETKRLPQSRLDDAFARQLKTKARFTTTPPAAGFDVIGCDEHAAIALAMAAWR